MQTPTTFLLVLAVSALVALPSLLAIVRKHPHWLAITVVDILLGWTVIGWVAALAWVFRPVKRREPRRTREAARTRSARTRRPTAPPKPGTLEPAANDNRSVPFFAEAAPPALASDIYEDWLEQGSALSEGAATASAPVLSPAASPSTPRAAA